MSYTDLQTITDKVNALLADVELGRLQHLRKELKPLSQRPSSKVFPTRVNDPQWVFHVGGRQELQFNLGFDQDESGGRVFRYGVAFSFETGGRVEDPIGPLLPWVRRFNDTLPDFAPMLPDLEKWRWSRDQRLPNGPPRAVEDHEVAVGEFIFFGWTLPLPVSDGDLATVAEGLNRLLPLYLAAISDDEPAPSSSRLTGVRSFSPRAPVGGSATTANRAATTVDVALRHNLIQQALYARLVERHGAAHVSAEFRIGRGCQVDIAVQHDDDSLTFYEIKAAGSARQCIREALGQLLEYGYWSTASPPPRELVVVGEHEFGPRGAAYIATLRSRFSIPIRYERVCDVEGSWHP